MKDSLLPEQGAKHAVSQLMGARVRAMKIPLPTKALPFADLSLLQPTSTIVPRNHPDFSRKLKHLQQSDPVNPSDLYNRLELFLAQQSVHPDGIVPRRVRRPRTSTTNSEIPSGPPTPPQNAQRNCFLPDSLSHHLDCQKFVDNATGKPLVPNSKRPESVVKNFAYPIPLAVVSPPSARQSTEMSDEPSISLLTTTLSANLPPGPRSSCIEPSKANIFLTQNEPVPFISEKVDVRQRPVSTSYVSRITGIQLEQTTTTPLAAKRASTNVIPQDAGEHGFESLPFLTLEPLSPLRNTLHDAPQSTPINSPGASATSPDARTSIATESTFANYMTAPTSPAAPPVNNIDSIATPMAGVTSRPGKRKSWHPRNLVASMKSTKNEANDRRQTESQTIAMMVEAARQGQAKEVKIKARPKSTAFENLSAGTFSVPDHRPGTEAVPPRPALVKSSTKDSKVMKQGKETPVKESIWNQRSRRKTVCAESEKLKDIVTSMPTMDKLRWKQLAMREKALADSKKAKGDRTTSSRLPLQQTEKPNIDQPPTMPAVHEPKKRFTRSFKVVPRPTISTQASRQRDPSPPTRQIPERPIKPQERPHSPVEVRPISKPKGEDSSEPSTSRNDDSPSTPISPLVLSLGLSSLPRGEHLLDNTPTSADGSAGADLSSNHVDRDARAYDPAHTSEAEADTVNPQRDSSKAQLQLGPFPPSRLASLSLSPTLKPLPQPPRFAPVQQKPCHQLTPLDIPASLDYTRPASPTREQQQPKDAREILITKVDSAPRVVSSPPISLSPTLEISSPQESAQWEVLPPREAPAPRDNMSSSHEEKSPIAPQSFDFRPQSWKDKTSCDTNPSQFDRQHSQPVLNQYGEPPHRPRASSTDVETSFGPSKIPASRATHNALRPQTSGGLQTTPVYTIQVRDNEIAEMTPASVKLLREQQNLLRRRALEAAGHSDPDAAMRRSSNALTELRDRARGTNRNTANKANSRSHTPLAGPGSARNPHSSRGFDESSPCVSLDRQGRIQTHLGSGATERKQSRSPLDSHRSTPPSRSGPVSVLLSSRPPSTTHSTNTSISASGAVPHFSGQVVEEMKLEREREINTMRARYGLPGRRTSMSVPYTDEQFGASSSGAREKLEAEKGGKRKGRDKWWKIWRVV
ncbi:hypothetical protein E2P81_ATG02497 [Venturia nashicola]|uniref:Uncharacterized protein n=1 Tax=Venturia nashicola TaxID=86259 RepID=A0A4Z1PFU0_9PEZI|nr:hypothetical protein E6O75_ATG02556 [Venturia nashicola]TLD36715.1 hypothetical protein E2P81_ATG02497 [Venturia nashicola]